MGQTTQVDDGDSATGPAFSLPAGATSTFETSRTEGLWARLFDQYADPPN